MSEDLVKRYKELEELYKSLETKKIQKETVIKEVTTEYQSSLERLKEKYEVSSLEEAKELKQQKQAKVEEALKSLKEDFKKYEDKDELDGITF